MRPVGHFNKWEWGHGIPKTEKAVFILKQGHDTIWFIYLSGFSHKYLAPWVIVLIGPDAWSMSPIGDWLPINDID